MAFLMDGRSPRNLAYMQKTLQDEESGEQNGMFRWIMELNILEQRTSYVRPVAASRVLGDRTTKK